MVFLSAFEHGTELSTSAVFLVLKILFNRVFDRLLLISGYAFGLLDNEKLATLKVWSIAINATKVNRMNFMVTLVYFGNLSRELSSIAIKIIIGEDDEPPLCDRRSRDFILWNA